MPSIETYELVLAAVAACEDKKAEDIRILALDPTESGLSDYFLICNGTNERQNVAITDEIEIRLKRDFGIYPNSVEGRRQGEWVLMDYVDFIVHVFSAEKREYYGLERLRKSATTISASDLSSELKERIRATREKRRTTGTRKVAPASGTERGVAAQKKSLGGEEQQIDHEKVARKPAPAGIRVAAGKKAPGKRAAAKSTKVRARKPAK